jgi:hypothetical protein
MGKAVTDAELAQGAALNRPLAPAEIISGG